jgi:hypothetical protein
MASDPVMAQAARTPMFIVGVVMLALGIVPFVLTVLLYPEGNAVGPGILMWLLVPIGSILVWRAWSRALQNWRHGK